MHASAQHDDPEEFLSSHGCVAERVVVTSSGSAPGGPNGNPQVDLEATGKFPSSLSRMVQTYRHSKEPVTPFI